VEDPCAAAGKSGQLIRQDDLGWFVVAAPDEQPVLFREAVPCPTSAWRAGIDQFHDPAQLEKAIVKLREKELDDMGLEVRDHQGSPFLVTTRALKEHDILGVATALLFSSPGLARDFMNQGGNAALMDGPLVRVTPLRTAGVDGLDFGPAETVYSVLVGAMALLGDYRDAPGMKVPIIAGRPVEAASTGRPAEQKQCEQQRRNA
jgi:hypothetical protein